MRVRTAALLRVRDHEQRAHRGQLARVPDLAAGLGVEGRAIEHHLARFAGLERLDRRAVLQQRHHPAARLQALIALKQRARVHGGRRALLGAELAGFLGAAALRLHRGLKACHVDGEAALARDVRR